MRTAEEILISEFDTDKESLQTAIILNSDVHKIISAINEARKEAIKECAEIADRYISEIEGMGILKKSVLSLINELN